MFSKKNDKVAIIADAHALYEPTKAALKDIQKRGIKKVYSLGDNIGIGPNPNEVMNLINRYGVTSIAGNYEYMLKLGLEPFKDYIDKERIEDVEFTKTSLTNKQIKSIFEYPSSIDLQLGDKKVGLCHFANDVRCGFMARNSYTYQALRNFNMPEQAYKQLTYTNTKDHLIEVASNLGMNIYKLINIDDIQTILSLIREFVIKNRKEIETKKDLGKLIGYLSYTLEPLFYSNGKLHNISDYDAIIQGHVHFKISDTTGDTPVYSIRSVSTGYEKGEEHFAQYTILENNEGRLTFETVNVEYDRDRMIHSILNSSNVSKKVKKYTRIVK